MKSKSLAWLAVLAAVTGSSSLHAAGPSAAMLAGTCAACHGTNGSSVGVMPTIAGSSQDYFIETMQAFRSGERESTVMGRVAKGYSDEELKAMAGYFAAQPAKPMKQDFDPNLASFGKKIHKESCEKCHEDGGKSNEDSAVLAGQSMIYLGYSLDDFNGGSREMPKKMKKKMQAVMDEHGKAGINALLHYYSSQQ